MNRFHLPYHLTVEPDVFMRVPEVMEDVIPDIREKKTILVTEENLKGLFSHVIDEISRDFVNSEVYLISSSGYDDAVALAKYITMNNIRVVIGFGGGTVLDLAKFAAYVSKAKLISLVTTLSNDSLASPVAVLGTEGKARKSFSCTIPDAIIVDTQIIKSAPERQLLAGIGDTVSKYTALYDWRLAAKRGKDNVDDFACMISEMALDAIRIGGGELKSDEFIVRLTQALVMGGLAMEIAGCSRPSSGSEHLFCHALEENYSEYVSLPHGIAVAMGSYGAAIFQERDVEMITELMKSYHLPVNPSSWKGLTEEIFVGAWQTAAASRPDRYSILNETELSEERLKKIYQDMCSIF